MEQRIHLRDGRAATHVKLMGNRKECKHKAGARRTIMEHVIATINDADKILVADVTAWVQVTTSPGGVRGWHGLFVLPHGSSFPVGGPYALKTNNGRSGQILISTVGVGSHQDTEVRFTGTGPFG
jgi:hypothetical protein